MKYTELLLALLSSAANSVILVGETGTNYQETAQQPDQMQTASGGGQVGEKLGPFNQRNNDKLLLDFAFKQYSNHKIKVQPVYYKKRKKQKKQITSQLTWQESVKAATRLKRKAFFCFTTCKNICAPQGHQKQLENQKCTTTMRNLDTRLRRVNLTEFSILKR